MSTQKSQEELKEIHGEEYVKKFEAQKERQKKRLQGILSHVELNREQSIVDFGCGNGLLFDQIQDKITSYSGVDFSREFIHSFQKKIEKEKPETTPLLYCEDIIEFAKNHPNEFDLAFTLDFSEHLYDDDFRRIYASILESLKAGGMLVLHTPNGNFFLEWMRNHRILPQKKEHIGVRSAQPYISLLTELGYKDIQVKMIPHYNVLKYLDFLRHLPLLGKFFEARILILCKK